MTTIMPIRCAKKLCGDNNSNEMGQYCFDDKEFGSIIISTRRGMKNIRLCVRNGMIELHVPAGINYTELYRIIDGTVPS